MNNGHSNIELSVSGMTCASCVRHVDRALRDLAGVSAVTVRLREGKVAVRHDPTEAPVETLIEALREAGYDGALAA
jgi:copper ion binding protein